MRDWRCVTLRLCYSMHHTRDMLHSLRGMIEHALLYGPTRRSFYWRRVQMLSAVQLVIVLGVPTGLFDAIRGRIDTGTFMYRAWFITAAVAVTGAAILHASRMTKRHQEPATRLLTLSDLGAAGVLLWGLVEGIGHACFLLLISMPLLAFAASFVRFDLIDLGHALLLLAVVIVVTQMLAALAASLVWQPEGAMILCAALVLSFTILGLIPSLFLVRWTHIAAEILVMASPYAALFFSVGFGRFVMLGLLSGGLWLLAACFFFLLARRIFLWRIGRLSSETQQRRGEVRVQRWRLIPRRPSIHGNPCTWFEFHVCRRGWYGSLGGFGLVVLLIIVLCFLFVQVAAEDVRLLPLQLGLFILAALVIGTIYPLSLLSETFSREWINQSIDLLLLTDLEDHEISLGKLRGVLLATAPWLVALAAAVGALALYLDMGGWMILLLIPPVASVVVGTCAGTMLESLSHVRPDSGGVGASGLGAAIFFSLAGIGLLAVAGAGETLFIVLSVSWCLLIWVGYCHRVYRNWQILTHGLRDEIRWIAECEAHGGRRRLFFITAAWRRLHARRARHRRPT